MSSTTKGFTAMLQELPRKKDCCGVILTQRSTLRKYEETNEMMRQFLDLSEATHKILLEKFTTHSRTLTQLKKDLENCFKRIRFLKTKLQAKYPEAFEATADAIKELQEKYNLEETERPPTYHDGDNTIQTTDITLPNEYDGDKTLVCGGEVSVVLPTNIDTNNSRSETMMENSETDVIVQSGELTSISSDGNVDNSQDLGTDDNAETSESLEISSTQENIERLERQTEDTKCPNDAGDGERGSRSLENIGPTVPDGERGSRSLENIGPNVPELIEEHSVIEDDGPI